MDADPNVPESRKSQFSTLSKRKEEDEMRGRYAILCGLVVFCLLVPIAVLGEDTYPAVPVANNAAATAPDPLLQLLVNKGVLNAEEAKSLSGTPAQQRARLLELLRQKGILSASDFEALTTPSPSAQVASNLIASTTPILPAVTNSALAQQPAKPEAPPAPKFIPAVAPVRVMPVDPPKHEGLVPALKLGPVRVTPYGFFKTSVVYDTSQPRGDDFPLPGFVFGDTGPDASAQFHIKARAFRVGSNFEWVDVSPELTITGKFEYDFEGNFSAVDNRNVSSIRSNMPSLRLAYGRLDYAATDKTTVFGVFGQDWTPFGSSVLPNTLETSGVGIAFGSLYERNPQVRGGFVHNFGGPSTVKLLAEAAAVLPAFGNVPGASNLQIPGTVLGNNVVTVPVTGCATPPCGTATVTIPQTPNTGVGLANQLAFGERQGADSARPEVEARAALQFQLDKAPGVAPAQFIVSGVQARRAAIVIASSVPNAPAPLPANFYKAFFPHGARVDSQRYGIAAQAQLPTRWFTLLGSWYHGADLRFFFAGQLLSFYNNTAAQKLINTATAPSIDGSAAVVFGNAGTVAAPVATIAEQRPIRTSGGFAELGLPLSRWAHADPSGRNAGWTMNLHYGLDDAKASDVRKLSPGGSRDKSDWAFANLQYKLNAWVTFGLEESLYRTRAIPNAETGKFTGTLFQGLPSREWKDMRSEFATIFTF
jgi:hypothetical protein